MLDPVSALAIATSAFNLLKKGISAGRELEDMAGQLGTWFGAVSDVKSAEEEAKDPPLFKKLISSRSVEQEALQALVARKKIEQQERELRELIVWRWGTEEYTAMMRDRARIKDTRERALLNQRRKMRKLIQNVLTVTVLLGLVGIIIAFVIGIIQNLR
jgi:predicted transcriptional regulator